MDALTEYAAQVGTHFAQEQRHEMEEEFKAMLQGLPPHAKDSLLVEMKILCVIVGLPRGDRAAKLRSMADGVDASGLDA